MLLVLIKDADNMPVREGIHEGQNIFARLKRYCMIGCAARRQFHGSFTVMLVFLFHSSAWTFGSSAKPRHPAKAANAIFDPVFHFVLNLLVFLL